MRAMRPRLDHAPPASSLPRLRRARLRGLLTNTRAGGGFNAIEARVHALSRRLVGRRGARRSRRQRRRRGGERGAARQQSRSGRGGTVRGGGMEVRRLGGGGAAGAGAGHVTRAAASPIGVARANHASSSLMALDSAPRADLLRRRGAGPPAAGPPRPSRARSAPGTRRGARPRALEVPWKSAARSRPRRECRWRAVGISSRRAVALLVAP